jgi:hypothetical protein
MQRFVPSIESLEDRQLLSQMLSGLSGALFPSVPAWRTDTGLHLAQPVAPPALVQPSPAMLANKVVHLTQAGNLLNAYGTLTILSTALQADGSYTFQGIYTTAQSDIKDSHGTNPPIVVVTGTLGVPQYTTIFHATCTIYFNARTPAVWLHDNTAQLVDEHVNFNATVTMNTNQATVYGQLYDCPEDPMTHMPLDQMCGSPPTSGTFV